MSVIRIAWKPIARISADEIPGNGALSALDALRQEWFNHLSRLLEPERVAIRQRTLRKLAIETGIIERLYDIDWGLTLTLVAEGFAKDVVERVGGAVDERTLTTLRAQMDSLQMVIDFTNSNRPLSVGFVKELHAAITRTQKTYEATDTLGRPFERELAHGQWKTDPNHVLRQDGTLLEYTPPEHVPAEMDRLVEMFSSRTLAEAHPIVQAAWLHHRFVQIHPFADGNGRVARALTLLVLQKDHYAPLVVDRWHRKDYLAALDRANDGSLDLLIRLFVKLESAALANELDRPSEPVKGFSRDVAHTLADQLLAARQRSQSERERQLRTRAATVAAVVGHWFESKRRELWTVFQSKGLNDIHVYCDVVLPPDERSHWYQTGVIDSARRAGHYADFSGWVGWARLRLRVGHQQAQFIASLHGSGKETGVMAVTTFAELSERPDRSETRGDPGGVPNEHVPTTVDAFHFLYSEDVNELRARAERELETLLDEGLTETLAVLLKRV